MISFSKEKVGFLSIFILCAIVIVLRRPDIITDAVPWAEDGKVWLSQAHNIGISSLFLPQDGYFQTISRIAYYLGGFFGLENAPLVATLSAIALRCSMCAFFMSSRLDFISYKVRFALMIYFLLMPNIYEGYVNITNAQWYLSLYAIGVLLAERSESTSWKFHDLTVLLISGLSGPFVIFLMPCLFFKYGLKSIKQRSFKILLNAELVLIFCCFIAQSVALFNGFGGRSSAPLGASLSLLADILAMRLFFGAFIDNKYMEFIANFHLTNLIILSIYFIFIMFIFFRGDWRARSLFSFAIIMMASSFYRPMMSLHSDQWLVFLKPSAGERYFFITNFIFICSIAYILNFFSKGNENIVSVCLLMLCIPTLYSFHIYKVPAPDYKKELLAYEHAKSGDVVSIGIAPPGWKMTLEKR